MSKKLRRVLSLLLAVVMVISMVPESSARAFVPEKAPMTEAEKLADIEKNGEAKSGTGLELEDLDPSTLNVKRLDEVDSESSEVKEEPLYSADDIVRVSIVLDKPSTLAKGYSTANIAKNSSAMAYRASLKNDQAAVTAAIEKALDIDLDVEWNLTLAVNVISANVRYDAIEAIKAVSGVKDVQIENRYEMDTADTNTASTSQYMTGAADAWASGYTGAGGRIAIIDTGINYNHKSFDPDAYEYALEQNAALAGMDVEEYKASLNLLDKAGIEAVIDELNANNKTAKHTIDATQAFKNSKNAFAFNYIDGNYNTDHYSDSQGNHGSHVAGIAAANRFVKDANGGFVDAASAVGAVGQAPDAQLLTMKVFGAGGGAYDSDYFAAIEDAIILGCDSANLSLGSAAPGFSFAGAYQEIMDSLVESGTVVTMSAGNSGTLADNYEYHDTYADDVQTHAGGSPGSFINSLGIASADNIGSVGTPLVFNGDLNVFYMEPSENNGGVMKDSAGTYDYVYIDGVGNAEEYAAVNAEIPLEGKLVITNRGAISFYVKGNNLIDYKPVGLVIANNQPGTINMALSGFTGKFSMVSITQAAGNAIKEGATKTTIGDYDVYTGSVEIKNTIATQQETAREDAIVSSFSSWGAPDSLIMKPEITTPGGGIYSVSGMTEDQYESMNGTSMAAPHAAGLAAVLGQYMRENDVVSRVNAVTGKNLTQRNIINALLMSTATPMINDGEYVPILQSGAGLAEVSAAVNAKSLILMEDDATISAADGKVKVELGQDTAREGKYTYSFTINNFSDDFQTYALRTDMFTQDTYEYDGEEYMDYVTTGLASTATYDWDKADVDKDGDLDMDDAQAILDFVTGLKAESEINKDAADLDKDGNVTSYDAQLMLEWLGTYGPKGADEVVVPAGASVKVTATITLSEDAKASIDRDGGAYLEGNTFITSTRVSDEGVIEDVEYSIPILGYFGSWTDATMFDSGALVDTLYGSTRTSYFGNDPAEYMNYKVNGKVYTVVGNPYTIEDEYPAEKVSINKNATITNVTYGLTRNGFGTGIVYDQDGKILYKTGTSQLYKAYYHVNNGVWMDTANRTSAINADLSQLGLQSGDQITAGYFVVPEYYAWLLDRAAKSGAVAAEDVVKLHESGEIGDGALIGGKFNIDGEAPVLKSVTRSDDFETITVTAQDDVYLAYLAVMNVAGTVTYLDVVPDSGKGEEFTYTFKLADTDADLGNGVAIFVGDYAGNEDAAFVRLGRGPVYDQETIFVPAESIEIGKNYIITNSQEAGTVKAFASIGGGYTVAQDVTVLTEGEETFIKGKKLATNVIFKAADQYANHGALMQNVGDGLYVSYLSFSDRAPYMHGSWMDVGMTYDAANQVIKCNSTNFLGYNEAQANFLYSRAQNGNAYIWVETTRDVEIDPDNASEITIEPETAQLVAGVEGLDKVELTYEISPIVLSDKSVTWTSSDEAVATVDEKGVVTGLTEGSAVITATSNKTPSVSASMTVNVIESEPLSSYTFAQVTIDGEPQWVIIYLDTMEYEILGEGLAEIMGGGRSGNYAYGIDTDSDYDKWNLEDLSAEVLFSMNMAYAPLDAASIPKSRLEQEVEVTPAVTDEDGNVVTPAVTETKTYDMDFDVIAAGASGYLQLMKDSSLNYFNLSSLGLMRAIAFAGITSDFNGQGETDYIYYMMNDEGMMYMFIIYPEYADGEFDLSLKYGEIGQVTGMPISSDDFAYSMNYLGFNSLSEWGDNAMEGVLLADTTYNNVWFIDTDEDSENFLKAQFVGVVDGATNIAALFNNDIDSIDTLIEDEEQPEDPTRTSQIAGRNAEASSKITKMLNKVTSEKIEAVMDVDASKAPASSGAVNKVTGSGNAISAAKPAAEKNAIGTSAKTEVTYTENKDVNNGFVTITYDPTQLIYVDAETGKMTLTSLNPDKEAGELKFAYASVDSIAAGEKIAKFIFDSSCDDSEYTATVKERNDELGLEESTTIALKGTGHLYGTPTFTWAEDYSSATATFVCGNNAEHTLTMDAEVTCEKADGKYVYTATVTLEGNTYTDVKEVEFGAEVTRLYGKTRYKTAIANADLLKAELGVEKFDTMIVATGTEYADALTGAYLSVAKNAPILLVNNTQATPINLVSEYIKNNLSEGGKVYVLGGVKAVDDTVYGKLEAAAQTVSGTVERIAGGRRETTNIAILNAAGVPQGSEILVTTGYDFADALAVSSTGKPVLAMDTKDNKLLNAQKTYLESLKALGCTFTIIGDAVSAELEAELAAYGDVTRISGDDQHLQIAEKYFEEIDTLTVVRGKDPADGLSVGALATLKNSPIVLVDDAEDGGDVTKATDLTAKYEITKGYVISGPTFITDEAIATIFGKDADVNVIYNE